MPLKDPIRRALSSTISSARRRCYNAADPQYPNYGARGIEMCDDWREAPRTFVEWALSNGYRHGLYLDRIDSDGPYSPRNCRFVTPSESSRNRRANIQYRYNGRTQCLASWAEEKNLPYETLRLRYHRGDHGEELFRPVNAAYRHRDRSTTKRKH